MDAGQGVVQPLRDASHPAVTHREQLIPVTEGRNRRDHRRRVWRQFLYQARMLRAMELLVEPRANITAVAYEVGFNSLSAFAKGFTRFTGQTPSEFRRGNEFARTR